MEKERLEEIISVIKECHLVSDRSPENVRLVLEKLGPTFIKLGQIMSDRDDIIPQVYADELKNLKSNVKPMPFSEVMNILDKEYNGETLEIFKFIELEPIGSASIAQVHKAMLKNGNYVVIKIKRLHIYEMMSMDVSLFKKAINLSHIDKLFNSPMDFCDVLNEIFESAKEEMDFVKEREHMLKFKELNKNIKYIKVPEVYADISTSAALVMEYIDGTKLDDVSKIMKEGYNPSEVAKKLAANYVKQAIDDGFFHADPHSDNIRIKNGQIVYLDFGMMGKLSSLDRSLLSECIIAILKDDIREVSRILLTLGSAKSDVNHVELNNDIRTILDKVKNANISDIDMKVFLNDMLKMLSKNNISLPKNITMLIRGILTIEGTLKTIDPSINLMEILSTHVNSGNIINANKLKKIISNGMLSAGDLVSLPNEVLTFVQGVNRGEVKFNIEINDSKKQLFSIENLVYLLIFTILDVAYIVGTSLIVINNKEDLPFIFYLYLILGGLCTFWILYNFLTSRFRD